jgi:hypothetical protein
MLPYGDGCEPGDLICCDVLFSVGESIKDHALAGVNNPDCYLDECHNPNVDGIVTIGRASSYPQADLLTVSMERLSPRQVRPAAGRATGSTSFVSVWQVELIESGWVTFEDAGEEEAALPDPGYVSALAMHSYSHAEQMFRRVANAVSSGKIAGCPGNNCGASLGDLTPIEPRGHLVGWTLTVTVPVDLSQPCSHASE